MAFKEKIQFFFLSVKKHNFQKNSLAYFQNPMHILTQQIILVVFLLAFLILIISISSFVICSSLGVFYSFY